MVTVISSHRSRSIRRNSLTDRIEHLPCKRGIKVWWWKEMKQQNKEVTTTHGKETTKQDVHTLLSILRHVNDIPTAKEKPKHHNRSTQFLWSSKKISQYAAAINTTSCKMLTPKQITNKHTHTNTKDFKQVRWENKQKMTKGGVAAVLVILAVVAVAVQRGEAVACTDVDGALAPCVNYLMGHEPNPPPPCCAGVKRVKGLAVSPADKRVACGCIKDAADHYPQLSDVAAASLPRKCDVEFNIPISRDVDCTK